MCCKAPKGKRCPVAADRYAEHSWVTPMSRADVGPPVAAPEAAFKLQDLSNAWFAIIVACTCILNWMGGFMNGSALAGVFKTTLTHLTGTTTRVATLVINPAPATAIYTTEFYGGQIGSLFLAAVVVGLVLGRRRNKWLGRQTALLFLEAALLWAAPFLHRAGHVYLAAHCISAACGLQNALTSNVTWVTIRSTNVTGTIVDIGSAIGLVVRDGWGKHGWRLCFWVPAYAAFFIGALSGAAAYDTLGDDVLLVTPACATVVALGSLAWTLYQYRTRALRGDDVREWATSSPLAAVKREHELPSISIPSS